MKIFPYASIVMVSLATVASPSAAETRSSAGARINGWVPEICRLSAGSFTVQTDGTVRGSVQEICNTNSAFQIVATHRSLGASEEATVRYAQAQASLSESGLTQVAVRRGQSVATVPIVIDARNINAPIAIAFTLSLV
ncbi:MAG: hypothetical protein AAFZ11_11175 [Pseudomonadota bacterium]